MLVFDWNWYRTKGKVHACSNGAHVDFDILRGADGDWYFKIFFGSVLFDDEAEHGLANDVVVPVVEDDFETGLCDKFGSVKATLLGAGLANVLSFAIFGDVTEQNGFDGMVYIKINRHIFLVVD